MYQVLAITNLKLTNGHTVLNNGGRSTSTPNRPKWLMLMGWESSCKSGSRGLQQPPKNDEQKQQYEHRGSVGNVSPNPPANVIEVDAQRNQRSEEQQTAVCVEKCQ